MKTFKVYVIGKNEFGEFGLNHKENVKKLTLVPDLTEFNINCISSGDGYTIYGNTNTQKFFSCGYKN